MERLKRGAGVLMPVFALPSKGGIGTLGKEAYEFVDWLYKAGMKYWQVLPLGITSFGDSPYQSPSAYAGNPYFIDIDNLVTKGLLERSEVTFYAVSDSDKVDYEAIYEKRYALLRLSYDRFDVKDKEYVKFCRDNKAWLDDYALFAALKVKYDVHNTWHSWPLDIRYRKKSAIAKVKKELAGEMGFYSYMQFMFYSDFMKLKAYAHEKGISIIGDMPLYVAYDSADVWSDPKQFLLDENLNMTVVAGCPPDCFSADGQKWGNPIYDWKYAKSTGYEWFTGRVKRLNKLYDIIRIDHFIGIVKYYNIPFDKSAVHGYYKVGPGGALVSAILDAVPEVKLIAEDLGVYMPKTGAILEKYGIPNMKVTAFAFDSDASNDHLFHNHKANQVVYIGTHDNDTLMGQLSDMGAKTRRYMEAYLEASTDEEIHERMIRSLYASVADVAVFQVQDLLMKGREYRTNYPSTIGGNWKLRIKKGELTASLARHMKELAITYGRL